MISYPCVLCVGKSVINTEKRFLYLHIRNFHRIDEIVKKLDEFGFGNLHCKSKHILIELLIDASKIGGISV